MVFYLRFVWVCFVFSPLAHAMTVTAEAIGSKLAAADLVAEIEILAIEATADSQFHVQWQAVAQVERWVEIRRSELGIPREGEQITLHGIGGEVGGIGVYLSGMSRPRKGKRYRAYLVRDDSLGGNGYRISGFDFGLVPLDKARTYTLNRTDGSDGEGNGAYLRWGNEFWPVPYFISSPSFHLLPLFVTAIDESFQVWTDVSGTKVDFLGMGCTSSTANENDGINNVVLMTQSWPFDESVIAITRNFYVADNSNRAGYILDSDLLLNAVHHGFTVSGESGKHDVKNIVVHEIGHILGLGHEAAPINTEATMYSVAQPGETLKCSLDENDLTGLRMLYEGPSNKIGGPTLYCNVAGANIGCASVHRRANRGGATLLILLVYLAVMIGMGRRLTSAA